jgi:beta-glucosidase
VTAEVTDSDDEVRALVGQLDRAQKLHLTSGDAPLIRGNIAMTRRYNPVPIVAGRIDAKGIDGIRFTDGPRGVVMGHCTAFPVPMARGATFDPGLEAEVGDAIGVEARTLGANLFAGVCINLLRHPAWGRAQETYGEDTYLLGEMGAALVRGTQRHVMACVKHYACNSMENSRFWVDVRIDEADLRDIYLPHFKRCIDEGAASVMSAYNKVNGRWCGQNQVLLNEILREEWGFDGFVMSDFLWGVRGDPVDCFNAGLDLEMPFRWRFRKLGRAMRQARVSEARLDEAATRLLRQQARQKARGEPDRYRPEAVCSPEHRRLAHRVAVEGTVLLENRDVLPFDTDTVRSVAVFGKLAMLQATGDKGSSQVHPPEVVTLLDGVRAVAATHGVAVAYDDGSSVERAVELAGRTDAVIVVAGNSFEDEGEWIGRSGGDRRRLTVAPDDEKLIEALAKSPTPTTVVLLGGSAFITDPWRHHVGALVAAWYPGMEGGRAVADILFGHEIPGGRLPCSWPASSDQLPPFKRLTRRITYGPLHGYRMFEAAGTRPAYPFGYGLGYTTIEWVGPEVVSSEADRVTVRVRLHNAGIRPGVTVVQGYVAEPLGSDPRPLRTLRAFEKVRLEPGATAEVTLALPIPSGATAAWVGPSSDPDQLRPVPLPSA